jgi:hypothetical protein
MYDRLLKCLGMAVLTVVMSGDLWAQRTVADFKPLWSMVGTWRMSNGAEQVYEVWRKEHDTSLRGRGFAVRGKDTVSDEEMRLTLNNGQIIFSALAKGQNEGKEVPFMLSRIGDSGFVFENPAHDFPQAIWYWPTGDSLIAAVGGNTGKGYRRIPFRYTRVVSATSAMRYFMGKWQVEVGNVGTRIKAIWAVEQSLKDAFCLSGFVQLADGSIFTRELITYDAAARTYMRHIAANDSSIYTLSTSGWAGNKLTWRGLQVVKTGKRVSIKEVITMQGQNSCTAEYFRLGAGKWVPFVSERLTRTE